jgi:hypothetical protein
VGEVEEAITNRSEVIEDYPDDMYGSSCLIFGFTRAGRPLHIQCSYPGRPFVKIVTVYEPDPNGGPTSGSGSYLDNKKTALSPITAPQGERQEPAVLLGHAGEVGVSITEPAGHMAMGPPEARYAVQRDAVIVRENQYELMK